MAAIVPIPSVPKRFYGLMGNLPNIDPEFLNESIWQLTELYGAIYELDMVSRGKMIVLSTYELLEEVLKDDKFDKCVIGALDEVRLISYDGLFTAYPQEDNWFKAHRILMPVFGPIAVRKMFDDMVDIAGQLVMKWDRTGPNQEIDIVDDMTRLAFDTIGLCAFSYRFNNFYSVNVHPFVTQMGDALLETGARATRTQLETSLRYFSQKKLDEDVGAMHKLCDDLVEDRFNFPQPDNQDLLNTMLNVKDPETGEKLTKENIRYQMVTFLIAGHETTSGTLSFLFYLLLQNPEKYYKAQMQIDEVLGDGAITMSHLPKLKYIDACIKETLRVQGPINLIGRQAKKTEVIGGKYEITPEHSILVDLHAMHRDTAVWGEDAKEFRPERWFEADVPWHAWKPFGTGARACIGRAFTEQEMLLTVALILQRFQITAANPAYNLQVKSTLTVKPHNFNIKATRRPGKSLLVGLGNLAKQAKIKEDPTQKKANGATIKPLTILYGSNAGTCKTYADELASESERFGFETTIKTCDSAVEHIPTDHPVVIIVPSYEGLPADNAKKFCSWLESNAKAGTKDHFKKVNYALFGVGNSEWASTYHKVPKSIHDLLGKLGATAVVEPGFVDVKYDAVGPWEDWCEKVWPALAGKDAQSSGAVIKATIQKADSSTVLGGFVATEVTVKENVPLTHGKGGPVKMHMEVELPAAMKYQSGDYLVVIPWNNLENVRRVISRFGLHADDMIHVTESRKIFLKTPHPISIFDLLTARVELSTPVTKRQLEKLAELTPCPPEKKRLVEQLQDFETNFLKKRYSVLDVLEDYQTCTLEFIDYLDLLQQLSPRQYSISSSPFHSPASSNKLTATITYDVLVAPALSGSGRTHYGPCSTMLSKAKAGSRITATVRSTNTGFHLPTDPKVPVIMISAGTGVAPMRGFLQERAAIKRARGPDSLGPCLLYFGCRNSEDDFIYKQELEHWEAEGIVSLRMCFSREKEGSGTGNFKYTSDRIYAEREEVAELFKAGAKIFVCGSASKIGKSTADVCLKIWKERNPDKTEEEAAQWAQSIKEDRYVSDVFG